MVTGATSGIGKAVSTQLATMGARVVLVCRGLESGEKARKDVVTDSGNPAVEVLPIELSSLDSVRKFARAFKEGHDSLHLLLNNAAVVLGKRIVTADGLEQVFQVNYLSHFLLTLLLLDVPEASAPSRIVNIVSSVHTHIDFDDLQEERGYNAVRFTDSPNSPRSCLRTGEKT